MSSPTTSTRPLRTVCLGLIVLGLLAAGYVLWQRVRAEASSRAVEIVVDYNEVIALAGAEGVLPNNVFIKLKTAGATAVALPEETLETLEAQGAVNLIAHPAGIGTYPGGWAPTDPVFTVETSSSLDMSGANTFAFVSDGLQRVYPAANLSMQPPYRILVRGDRETVQDIGLGLDESKARLIRAVGLRVVPRLHGSPVLTSKSLNASLATLARLLGRAPTNDPWIVGAKPAPTAQTDTQLGIVIFDGDTIPGYRALIPTLAEGLTTHHLVYGAVEFSKQKGDAALGKALNGRLVRVHSISREELATMTPGEAVQRFGLAAKDRNIRVLYVHVPPVVAGLVATTDAKGQAVVTESRRDDFARFIAAVKFELTKNRFTVSDAKQAHPFTAPAVPAWALGFIFLGGGAAFFLLVLAVLPAALPSAWITVGFVFLGIGAAKAFVLASQFPDLGRMGFGLFTAICFPLLALVWTYRQLSPLSQGRMSLFAAVRVLLVATGITVLGGLLIAAMLTDARYLVKMTAFVGVKAALAAPLLLFGLLVITDGVAKPDETVATWWARVTAGVRGFLNQPLYLWGILLAFAALVVVALMLARSGNEGGVGVSDLELRFRSVLEQWLIARPRTKEFLLGHPLFLLGLVAAMRHQRVLALVLLVGGAIGQVDVLNTFCHAHTPVTLSLLRVINGLWLGVIIGVIAAVIVFRRKPEVVKA